MHWNRKRDNDAVPSHWGVGEEEHTDLDVDRKPDTKAVRRGWHLEESGDLNGAATAYAQLIEAGDPVTAPEAALFLGRLFQTNGEGQRAVAAYSHAVAANHPTYTPAGTLAIADLLVDDGFVQQAIPIYQDLMKSENRYYAATAAFNLGSALSDDSGRNDSKALAAYGAAVSLGQAARPYISARAEMCIARWLVDRGRGGEALELLSKGMQSQYKEVQVGAYLTYGYALADRGNIAEALVNFKKVAAANHPEFSPVAQELLDTPLSEW